MAQLTNNIPNSTADFLAWIAGTKKFTIECESGYMFDGQPVFKSNDGWNNKLTPTKENTYAEIIIDDYKDTIKYWFDGNTKKKDSGEPTITNNVPNTTFNVEKSGTDIIATLTCETDYVFDGIPTVTYTGLDGTEKTVNLTVNAAKNIASITSSDWDDSKDSAFNGSTKVSLVTNNIPHSQAEVTTKNTYVTGTVTCDDGYIFDGVPTVSYTDLTGDNQTENLTLNAAKNVGTFTSIYWNNKKRSTFNGNTKQGKAEPTEPTIVNNVTHSNVTYKGNSESITLTVTSTEEREALNGLTCVFTDKDGEVKTEVINVTYTVTDSKVNSVGSVTIRDVDYTKDVTINGNNTQYHIVMYTLSGCVSSFNDKFVFDGATINVTLTATEGNEFGTGSKAYIEPQGSFAQSAVQLTVSNDKETATGNITVKFDDDELVIYGETTQKTTPVIGKYGFVNAFVVTNENLEDFAKARFITYSGSDPTDSTDSLDLANYINRVKRYFFEVDKGSLSKLKLGDYIVNTDVFNLKSDVKVVNFGTIDVPNFTESTADYSTDVILFVPFVGLVSVDSEVIGQTVNLVLSVNLLSGTGVYTLTCADRIVWTQEVTPCTDVIYRTPLQETFYGGDFNSNYLMGLKPYLVIDHKQLQNEGAQVATERFITIGDLTGYNKVTDVLFTDTRNMLQEDVNEITQILRTGFTL